MFGYDTLEGLRRVQTHSDLAVDTFRGYSADLVAIAELASVESRLVPVHVLWDFIIQGDRDQIRERYCAVRTAEILAGSRIPALDYPWEGNDRSTRGFGRVLNPLEIGLVRYVATRWRGVLATVNIAVFDTGGAAADLPRMTPARVELRQADRSGRFVFEETARTYARSAEIPAWALDGVDEAVFDATSEDRLDTSVGYTGKATRLDRVESAGLVMIGKVLERCGLAQDSSVLPSSITSTAGRAAWEQGGLDHAAQVLGLRSLDKTRNMIEIDPHGEPDTVSPSTTAHASSPQSAASDPIATGHGDAFSGHRRNSQRHASHTSRRPFDHGTRRQVPGSRP